MGNFLRPPTKSGTREWNQQPLTMKGTNMFSLTAPIRITDTRIKTYLLKTRPIFLKRIHTDRKAKDYLHALSLIEKDQPLDSSYAVRLLGQLPSDSQLYKDLFRHINFQLKESGIEIVDMGQAIITKPTGLKL